MHKSSPTESGQGVHIHAILSQLMEDLFYRIVQSGYNYSDVSHRSLECKMKMSKREKHVSKLSE